MGDEQYQITPMSFIISKEVQFDLEEAFDSLYPFRQNEFIRENIGCVTDDVLIQELVNRGYEITKG